MPKKENKYDRKHRENLSSYEREIEKLYRQIIAQAAQIGISLSDFKPDKLFSFGDYPAIKKRVDKLFQTLQDELYTIVLNGINAEWTLANNKNSELARQVFGDNVGKLSQEQYRRYFSNNGSAREAFTKRKVNGLNLSDRVWRYTEQFKAEIELGLDVGIRNGLSADEMSQELRQYLKFPDRLFRRVRDEHGNLVLSKRAAAFHPGRGVYRSSYKNARRLAATETNMAYMTADYKRWQQLDFIVGIRIVLSNNHTLNGQPFHDICDELSAPLGSDSTSGRGCYPKDFKFTGWHPLCRCHVVSILKTDEEIAEDTRRILAGEPLDGKSVNRVDDVPKEFKQWLKDNEERIARAKSLPYFLSDNRSIVGEPTFLNRDAVQFMVSASRVGDGLQALAENVAAKYGAACTPINYKTKASILRKVKLERQNPLTPNFRPSDLKDSVRTTIVIDKKNIENVIGILSQEQGVKALGNMAIKRQYGNSYIGYTGNIVNIKLSNGVIGEIQVNTPKMIYAKEKPEDAKRILGIDEWNAIRKETGMEGGLGHKYYEEWRVLNRTSKEAQDIARKSIEYYSHFTE